MYKKFHYCSKVGKESKMKEFMFIFLLGTASLVQSVEVEDEERGESLRIYLENCYDKNDISIKRINFMVIGDRHGC